MPPRGDLTQQVADCADSLCRFYFQVHNGFIIDLLTDLSVPDSPVVHVVISLNSKVLTLYIYNVSIEVQNSGCQEASEGFPIGPV